MSNTEFIQKVVELTNQFRAENGVGLLTLDEDLSEAAQVHSENMAYYDFFGHVGLDGALPRDRAENAGYETRMVGENIAAGFATPEGVVKGWINSESHRANMLDPRFNEIGVGYVYFPDDSGELQYRTYWAQVLGQGEIEQDSSLSLSPSALPVTTPMPGESTSVLSSGAGSTALLALEYAASNPDVLAAIGNQPDLLWQHYMQFGQSEGRALDTFDEVSYLASHGDLLAVFGTDTAAAIRHYVDSGYAEGRALNLFQADQYLASYDDLIAAMGYDTTTAGQHYLNWGHAEGRARDTFDEGRYLASNADLIQQFGADFVAATQHYIQFGMAEGRAVNAFDPATYLGLYGDLQAAFGSDLEAATRHFIESGFDEGRAAF
jgi:hypothetical protein